MSRILIIPAAGRGSRLNAAGPKFLYPVNSQPMIDRLLLMYANYVDHYVIVVNPDDIETALTHFQQHQNVRLVTQSEQSGMLDAILTARDVVSKVNPQSIWITWCDQVAVRQETIRRLAEYTNSASQTFMTFPTIVKRDPYIHFERDRDDKIVGILQRREGDNMPDVGENDVGLFAMTMATYYLLEHGYAQAVARGRATAERNFLPFIPWLAGFQPISTFTATDATEAIGVNTAGDAEKLAAVMANIDHES